MSEVWRADDEVLGRPVAVKVLAGQLAADPQLRATIQREARAAARLTHPHVTQVYDYGEATLPSGAVVPYLVMELVEGLNLADRLRAGPLPWPEAVRVAGQIAAALAAAHRIGVVHRDVKPGNVMLTDTGAKVLDFGIAALAGPHHPLAGQTGELLMGTPAYFAPERLDAGPPNPASDVYALGALLYRTLTGQAPLPVQTWEDALEVHQRAHAGAAAAGPRPARRHRRAHPGLPGDRPGPPAHRGAARQPIRRRPAGRAADRELLTALPPTGPAHPPTLIDRPPVVRPTGPRAGRADAPAGPSPCSSPPPSPRWSASACCSPRTPAAPARRRPSARSPRRRRRRPRAARTSRPRRPPTSSPPPSPAGRCRSPCGS